MTSDLETRYGFAAQLAAMSDEQLISRYNAEASNCGWGQARMYFSHCLRAELDRRSLGAILKQSEEQENN